MYASMKDEFDKNGFVVLENFLRPSECDEMVEAGLEFTSNLPTKEERVIFSSVEPEKKQLSKEYFINSNDKISYFFEEDALQPDGELKVEPSLCLSKVGHALHLLHPLFRCYTYCDRVKNVCANLCLKDPAVVQSMYIYKNPKFGGEVKAHQDSTYLNTSRVPPFGFWIALEDATVENGCLWFVPGSHKSGVHRLMIRNPDKESSELLIYDRQPPIYGQSGFQPVPVNKGSCVLIHGNVVHKSHANKSDKGRPAYTFHVIEKYDNEFSPDNWLQEGENAPFYNIYKTPQISESSSSD